MDVKNLKQIGFGVISSVFQENPLPFDTYGAISGVFMLFLWLITFLFCIMLIDAKLMSQKAATVIYLITFIIGGLLLVAIPNTLLPISEILMAIADRKDLWYLLPVLTVLTILFGTSLLVGRIFCGYACPLGTFQELLSKINFKQDIKNQKANKFHFEVSKQLTGKVRWTFVGILFFLAILLGINILPYFDPFSGFLVLRSPIDLNLFIAFVGLSIVGISSIFLYRPYCRFLCPFGAGSDLCSRYAKNTYQRTEDCTECGLCEKICPTHVAAAESNKGECYYCNRCIEICPEDAIKLNLEG